MMDTPIPIRVYCPHCNCSSITYTVQNFQLEKQRSDFHEHDYVHTYCINPECGQRVRLCRGYYAKKIITARAA